MTVPDNVKTPAYDYYGLGITEPQKVALTLVQTDAKGKEVKNVYQGTRSVTVSSVGEGTAQFREVQTGAPQGDLSQTESADDKGLFLESIDPGTLKTTHQMLLPANVAPGSTWKAHLELDAQGKAMEVDVTYHAVGIKQVQTKAGKQDALFVTDHYSGKLGNDPYAQDDQWWYVKGVGSVKTLTTGTVGGRKFSEETAIVG